MVFKLVKIAESRWRRLNGRGQLIRLLTGQVFVDGVMQERDAA